MTIPPDMQPAGPGKVLKVWLYAVVVVVVGAWITPVVYEGGKALAEVTSSRPTNELLARLGELCRTQKFPWFYQLSLWLVAAALFFPWLEWLYGHAHEETPAADAPATRAIRRRCHTLLRGTGAFLLAAGLWLTMAMAMVQMQVLALQPVGPKPVEFLVLAALAAVAVAGLLELLFRGIALGVFLRAMHPAPAVMMSAFLFACVFAMVPPPAVHGVDPEIAHSGLAMLGLLTTMLLENPCHHLAWILPWFMLGLVLGYARWRSKSLVLPVGLHAGWIFAMALQGRWFAHGAANYALVWSYGSLWLVVIAVVVAWLLLNPLIKSADDD